MTGHEAELLTELLAKHHLQTNWDGVLTCTCGKRFTFIRRQSVGISEHRAHVAEVITAGGWVRYSLDTDHTPLDLED